MAKKRMNMHISTRLFEQISLEIDQSYADEFQIQHIDINKIKRHKVKKNTASTFTSMTKKSRTPCILICLANKYKLLPFCDVKLGMYYYVRAIGTNLLLLN